MSDGAHFGLSADESLKAVLGDEDEPEAKLTAEQMAAYLESAPDAPDSYDDVSRWAGRGILHYLRLNPDAAATDAFDLFEAAFPRGPKGTLSELYPELEGISGFMVAWAVNAARYASHYAPVANPAIIEIDVLEQ